MAESNEIVRLIEKLDRGECGELSSKEIAKLIDALIQISPKEVVQLPQEVCNTVKTLLIDLLNLGNSSNAPFELSVDEKQHLSSILKVL